MSYSPYVGCSGSFGNLRSLSLFQMLHISEARQYFHFYIWLLEITMSSEISYVVSKGRDSLLKPKEYSVAFAL